MTGGEAFRRALLRKLTHGLGLTALMTPPVLFACGGTTVVEPDGASSSSADSTATGATSSSGPTTTSGGCGESGNAERRCLGGLNTPCPGDVNAVSSLIESVLNQECCMQDDTCPTLDDVLCGPYESNGDACCWDIVTSDNPCAIPGRPFMTKAGAVTAQADGSCAWLTNVEGASPSLDDVSEAQRDKLATVWCCDALAEHASIASFARFALEMLAVGAPMSLIEDAHRAAQDEVRHAQMSFAMAAGYARRDVGPQKLPLTAVPVRRGLLELAVATVHEGCVNETLSTIQAAERIDTTRDPRVIATLRHIVDDETGHAELAWRFIAWAIARGGDRVREAVGAAFDAAIAEHAGARGIADVIAPCAEALLIEVRAPDAALPA